MLDITFSCRFSENMCKKVCVKGRFDYCRFVQHSNEKSFFKKHFFAHMSHNTNLHDHIHINGMARSDTKGVVGYIIFVASFASYWALVALSIVLSGAYQVNVYLLSLYATRRKKRRPRKTLSPGICDKNSKPQHRQKIPASLRRAVWIHYCGERFRSKCQCCYTTTIDVWNFHAAHVVADKNGGACQLDNLRPTCVSCNLSMGTTNLFTFQTLLGYHPDKCNNNIKAPVSNTAYVV